MALIARIDALINSLSSSLAQSASLPQIASSYQYLQCEDAVKDMARNYPGGDIIKIMFYEDKIDRYKEVLNEFVCFIK